MKKVISIQVDIELYMDLKAEANRNFTSLSGYCASILREHTPHNGQKIDPFQFLTAQELATLSFLTGLEPLNIATMLAVEHMDLEKVAKMLTTKSCTFTMTLPGDNFSLLCVARVQNWQHEEPLAFNYNAIDVLKKVVNKFIADAKGTNYEAAIKDLQRKLEVKHGES